MTPNIFLLILAGLVIVTYVESYFIVRKIISSWELKEKEKITLEELKRLYELTGIPLSALNGAIFLIFYLLFLNCR